MTVGPHGEKSACDSAQATASKPPERDCMTCRSSINHRTDKGRVLVCVRLPRMFPPTCEHARSERGQCGPRGSLWLPDFGAAGAGKAGEGGKAPEGD